MRQSMALIPLAAIVLFLNACTAVAPIQFSRPASPAALAMSENGILRQTGLDLKVVPQNEYLSWGFVGYVVPIIPWPTFFASPDRPQFEILMVLDPTGDEFTLDPGRIALEFPGKPAISPVGFRRGPGAFAGRNVGVAFVLGEPPSGQVSCDVDFKAAPAPLPATPLPVSDRTCFALTFATPPPAPEEPFTLSVGGVVKAGQPFPIPPIHFEKGSTLFFVWGVPL